MAVILHLIRLAWVHSRFQVPFLSIVFESFVEIADGESIIHDLTGILHGHGEEVLQVLIIWFVLQVLLLPGIDVLSVPDQHVEVGVQQQHHIFLELVEVQLDRHGLLLLRGVAEEGGLHHHHAVGH